ncbi:MAG TPA: phage tail protein [Candidatus Krumholzibacteria bacterium]|nr:phage tail protein [Candidatus Krumholzibacteria bacterium]HRY42074.1 phage tail protein [Candidatus Krumholzibacteria bacterium]
MAFWVLALVYIVGTVLYDVLRPKPQFDAPTPSSLGDFQFPTIGEGRAIPVVWGTCKLSGPMVTWYGDLQVQAITKEVKTGLFSSDDVTVGYRYFLGAQLVLCSGEVDDVLQIRFDDRAPPAGYPHVGDVTQIHINAPNFFGGEESEGGVAGSIYVYHGSATQPVDTYLQDRLGDNLPAWRHVCYAVMRHVYLGTSPYIKAISFVVRRCPNSLGLTGGDENIDGDANPAAMIYDILISPASGNGLGLPVGFLDVAAFRSVGQTLADEGLGLSMLQDRGTTAKDLVLEILRHIDGVMYVEPTSGLLTIRLVRYDYDPEAIPVLDADSCTVKSFARPSWGDLKNTVRVGYVSRDAGFIESTAQAQDLAGIEVQGGEVSLQELTLRGLSNATNAQQAAARALAALAYPLATITIEADRSAWALRPGAVFKLVWAPLGIDGMVCRAVRVGTGRLDSGRIEIEAMEDIFAVDWTGYSTPPASGWEDPSGDVPALTDQAVLAAPYEAAKGYGNLAPGVQLAITLAARGATGISLGYRAHVADGAGGWAPPIDVPFFTPSGVLSTAIDELTSEIGVTSGLDTDRVASVSGPDFALGVNVAWLSHDGLEEFIAFKTVAQVEGGIALQTVARGCLDTAPTAFPAGTRVWFISYGSQVVNIRGPVPPTVNVFNDIRLQPYNNQSEYNFASCPTTQVVATTPARAEKVYCPNDLRFNGESYPPSITGELSVSWSHRNRIGTWSYTNSGKTATSEPGTEYDILVYGELDTLVHIETGLTDTSWTYIEATEIAESGLGRFNNHLRVVMRTYGALRAHVAIREIECVLDRI